MRILHIILSVTLLVQPVLAAERSATFSISNMTCALCPITVQSAMSQVEGVISVKVDQSLGQAFVRYDDAQASAETIAAASSNAGYPATIVQSQ